MQLEYVAVDGVRKPTNIVLGPIDVLFGERCPVKIPYPDYYEPNFNSPVIKPRVIGGLINADPMSQSRQHKDRKVADSKNLSPIKKKKSSRHGPPLIFDASAYEKNRLPRQGNTTIKEVNRAAKAVPACEFFTAPEEYQTNRWSVKFADNRFTDKVKPNDRVPLVVRKRIEGTSAQFAKSAPKYFP